MITWKMAGFAVLTVSGWLLMSVSAAAGENPWISIRDQAVALAEEAQLDWKEDKQQDAAWSRFAELAKASALPLSSEEIAKLVDCAATIVLPDPAARGGTSDEVEDQLLLQTRSQEWLVCTVAQGRIIQGMPEPERKSFRAVLDHVYAYVNVDQTIAIGLAAISMADHAESRDWLHRFVFDSGERHRLLRQNVPHAIPLLLGNGKPTLLKDLKELLAVEKGKATAKAAAGEPYIKAEMARFRAAAIVKTLETTINAENYCQQLKPARQRLFRDFYVRLHQAWACAPKGFHSVYHAPAGFAANIMTHKPTDTQFYLSFLKDWQASEVELYCISALYWKNGPMDVEELREIAAGETPSASWAADILDEWDKL